MKSSIDCWGISLIYNKFWTNEINRSPLGTLPVKFVRSSVSASVDQYNHLKQEISSKRISSKMTIFSKNCGGNTGKWKRNRRLKIYHGVFIMNL